MILNDILEITSLKWKLRRNDEVEGYGSGQLLTAEMATPLWEVDIITPMMEFNDGRRVRAILNSLTRPDATAEVYDPIAQYPVNDPAGAGLAGRTVTVSSVVGGKVALGGLPGGYKLTYGDQIQITWGANPVRQAVYEVSQDVTANGIGTTTNFVTMPSIHPGVTPAATVSLIKPKLKVKLVPGMDYGSEDSASWKMTGFTFSVIQKL